MCYAEILDGWPFKTVSIIYLKPIVKNKLTFHLFYIKIGEVMSTVQFLRMLDEG